MLNTIKRLFSRSEPSPVFTFARENMVSCDGSTITLNDLYNGYCNWSEGRGKEPLPMPDFSRGFRELGIRKEKIGGRIRYFDIAFRE